MSTMQRVLLVLALALGLAGVFASNNETKAATLQAEWSLFARADATSFAPGAGPAPSPAGYEIISFDAVGLAGGLATYTYGGPDLPPSKGGPVPALVTCDATITLDELHLDVGGGFPYAGCVFFVGVENTGDQPVRFELGAIGDEATVQCNVPGCQASDIEVLAGAPGADPLAACRVEGGPVTLSEGVYSLPPGGLVVCPVFIVVLQPAKENATYILEIDPPPPQEPPGNPDEPDNPPQIFENPPLTNREPPPGQPEPPTATPTPTPTPTPVSNIGGERTPGATPIAPATGDSVVVTREVVRGSSAAPFLLVVAVGLGIAAFWPRRGW